MGKRRVAAAVAAGVLLAGCGAEQHRPGFHDPAHETPEFSAARLGEPEEGSVVDFLEPEEREAVRRSGMTGMDLEPRAAVKLKEPPVPKTGFARAADTVGKVGVALLGVALTIGAAIAPFFLL
jgi:hypothetical protein